MYNIALKNKKKKPIFYPFSQHPYIKTKNVPSLKYSYSLLHVRIG
jgi:hypothetical protein